MSDRFLAEVCRIHDMRDEIRVMSEEESEQLMTNLGDGAADQWMFAARDAQLPPRDLDWCWLFLAGRGSPQSEPEQSPQPAPAEPSSEPAEKLAKSRR
jgi:hypothetical protein